MNNETVAIIRKCGRIVFLAGFLTTSTPLAVRAATEDLVGLTIRGQEVNTLLVLREAGQLWLPLDEFGKHVSLERVSPKGQTPIKLSTPFGTLDLPPRHTRKVAGVVYVEEAFLKARLNMLFQFSEETYSVAVEPPWFGRRLDPSLRGSIETDELVPEVGPHSYGWSTIHGDSFVRIDSNNDIRWQNSVRATGHAYGGVWQATYSDDLEDARRLHEFIWLKDIDDNTTVQIGHQTVVLHPLLGGVEMTGVQVAWSNETLPELRSSFFPGALLDRRSQRQKSFSGTGPVGGFAELWVNDRRIARRSIGLSGTYEFHEVPLTDRLSETEVRVYNHRNPTTPVEIIRDKLALADLMLDPGVITAIAGVGGDGNSVDRVGLTEGGSEGVAAFAFARYGFRPSITLEAAARTSERNASAMVGVIMSLDDHTFLTLAGGVGQDGQYGYRTSFDWERGDWKLFAQSRTETLGLRGTLTGPDSPTDETEQEHRFDLSKTIDDTLLVGVIGHVDDDVAFALPYISWRPNRYTSFRARPDRDGDYRVDAFYLISDLTSFHATVTEETANLAYIHRFEEDGLTLTAEVDFDTFEDASDGKDVDLFVSLSDNELFGRNIRWRAGVGYGSNGLVSEASLQSEIVPGVIGFIEASDRRNVNDGTVFAGSRNQNDVWSVRAGITFDFATGQDSWTPATRRGVDPSYGSLSGRITPGGPHDDNDLSDIPIRVNGVVLGRTEAGGTFHLPRVEKGVHRVEIEETNLPIEHVVDKRVIVAEVAPGASTDVSFRTAVEFGAAGRVLDAKGQAVSGIPLRALTKNGEVRGEAITNTFGYFRFDRLRAGTYVIKVDPEWKGSDVRSAGFTISNDYVFDVPVRLTGNSLSTEKKSRKTSPH